MFVCLFGFFLLIYVDLHTILLDEELLSEIVCVRRWMVLRLVDDLFGLADWDVDGSADNETHLVLVAGADATQMSISAEVKILLCVGFNIIMRYGPIPGL